MILDQEKITRIKKLLKARPKGLTISDISHSLKINRNSVAKYLEILLITGQVEMRMYGNAKVYYLSHRVPISSMLKFANELILVLDSEFRVVEVNDNFLSYYGLKKDDLTGSPVGTLPAHLLETMNVEDIARDASDSGEFSTEATCIRDGETKYLRIKAVPSVFDDGSHGITLIFEDITEKKRVEERLRVSEAKYRAIVEDQTELVGRFDKDLRILFANEAAYQFYQKMGGDLDGETILEFIHPEDREQVTAALQGLNRENPVVVVENRVQFRDGTIRWLQWTNRAIFNEEGVLIEYQGVGRDITERKEAEEELLVKDLAIAASINGIAIADLNGIVTYANKAYIGMFGYTSEADVLKNPIHAFAHGDAGESAVILEVWNTLIDCGSWTGEVNPRRTDGTAFCAFLSASLVRDSYGRPLCLMASFVDITDIKKAREELQLKNTAIATSINAIAIFDSQHCLIYANDSFLEEFDIPAKEVKGKHPEEILTRFETMTPRYEEIVLDLTTQGKWKGEVVFRKKDGTLKYMEASLRNTLNPAGKPLYMLASFIDISDHKIAEIALRSSRQKLQETIEFMPDPTFIIDKNHRVIAWNRALETLSGIKREDVLGRDDFHHAFGFFQGVRPVLVDLLSLPPHEIARNHPSVRRFGDSIYMEAYIPDMNGGKGAYLWGKASALIDREGHAIGAIESIRDISAWKQARESLRGGGAEETVEKIASPEEKATKIRDLSGMSQQLESVLGLMEEAVLLTDRSGTIVWANERFVDLVDGEREIVQGAHLTMFFPRDGQQILGERSAVPPGKTTLQVTLIPLTGNRSVPVEARLAVLPETDERVLILSQRPPCAL
ncbi:hypothetical protein ASZ90_016198 [hydrocarbon metagenome]|uniref:Sensory transduction histidine kinase n=1 Tax=hydrocarbon metagenome TaxID=938273 RepID=A0A0W8EZU6_9ZZZZ